MKEKTSEELLLDISKKLDTLISIIVIQGKNIDEQISILKGMNYSWVEIGGFLGMAPDAVRKRHSRNKN